MTLLVAEDQIAVLGQEQSSRRNAYVCTDFWIREEFGHELCPS
jgi:hypothetical protein